MPNNILITPGSASIQFSGSAANTIRLQVEASGSIAFYGNSGSLFGITDSLSGSLMSVNDISGLPILEVFSDDRIVMGTFNKNILVVTGSRIGIGKSAPTSLLDISGSVTITGSITYNSGGVSNLSALSMAVSGTITASGTTSVTLNLNTANYFSVSGSGTGTVTWAVTNPPITGRAQTFVIEYTNGGIKTNSWFTNTRWPAGIAPSLTSASANPDMLSFTTDDAGSNWRGLLLQRGSA